MEFHIEEKLTFTVTGISRHFDLKDCYQKIPAFWDDVMAAGEQRRILGMFGVCYDSDDQTMEYMIGDLYQPWENVHDGDTVLTFEKGLWAVFPCHGALPDSLQKVNTEVWSKWVPEHQSEYALRANYNIEMYAPMPKKPEDIYTEIWLPVRKVNG
ncbi:MAG: GyrI-like domain-containing protein [Lactimicrobium sp.]|jgi:AraC family transcriptional regulator|uniref:GyrI-like domain-containing protein n=1 Tax=Lactimicrobium sp. TaxID=2563780 RepID=UPI002F357C34